MNNLTERLNYALQITKIKKAELARAINVKPQTIQFLCNTQSNTQSSRYTFDIAAALGINVKWLASGDGDMFISDIKQIITMVPLLNHESLYKKWASSTHLLF